jgi:bifunctional DNA-binding transcriptional regulator/antitoxin component of YhaV-PrlF toxin-antitoxin module
MKTKLTKRGQTVVPAQIRRRFNLGKSSTLQWMIEGDLITVLPIPDNPAQAMKGALKGQISFGEFMADRQRDREMEKKEEQAKCRYRKHAGSSI